MKMGVERVLKENFPNLGVISAITPLIEVPALTIDAVNETLAKILPAVKGMGGTLSIENVDSNTGTVYIQFAGPERLKKGLEMVLRDSSLVKAVIFQELSI